MLEGKAARREYYPVLLFGRSANLLPLNNPSTTLQSINQSQPWRSCCLKAHRARAKFSCIYRSVFVSTVIMACRRITVRLVLFFLLQLTVAQRRGGGGGGGGGDHDDDDDFSGSGDSGGSGSGGSGGDSISGRPQPCDWSARHKAFGLPGLYYNGTLTIRHHITDNPVWDEEIEDPPIEDEFTNCQNDDRSVKTYKYPALLLIAPIGNESDTNPFHWQLRGYQPANQVRGLLGADFLDLEQRWVHIRSSDFVASNESVADYSLRWPARNLWRDADATQLDQVTRVYWSTNVTSESDGIYSSSARYERAPPVIEKGDYRLPIQSFGRHTSQYVTLSDVCVWNQVSEDIMGTTKGMPRSEITVGETNYATTTPTIWLNTGATSEMQGIGSTAIRMTVNNTLERTVPLTGRREAGCTEIGEFELGEFRGIHSYDDDDDPPKPWNLTLSVVLTFEGEVVRENSTSIDGMEDGKLVFGEGYVKPNERAEEEDDDDAGVSLRVAWSSLVIGLLLGYLIL